MHNFFGETAGGAGNLEWVGNGEGEVSLRATWDQGGRDRITPQEEGELTRKLARGVEKGELRRNLILSIYVQVYNDV